MLVRAKRNYSASPIMAMTCWRSSEELRLMTREHLSRIHRCKDRPGAHTAAAGRLIWAWAALPGAVHDLTAARTTPSSKP